MWKDYFSFNKGQRNGIIVLLSLIVIMITWLVISNHLSPIAGNLNLSDFKTQTGVTQGNSIEPTTTSASLIELNSAGFSLLESNPKTALYADAIVKYRDKLGGFVNKEQLLEVPDMDSLRYKDICNYISIDSTKIHKLLLNKATMKEFAKHPYIGYYMAQAIFNYREEHGNYKTLNDLLKNAAIDNITFSKLAPYLSIN